MVPSTRNNCPTVVDKAAQHILSVAEDKLTGFFEQPIAELARRCGLPAATVATTLCTLRNVGIVRALRQTVLTNVLAPGCLVAWELAEDRLQFAYSWLIRNDPFSGHIVIRRANDVHASGAAYRLWTTLRLPDPDADPTEHCHTLARYIGANNFVCMPTVGMFRLSVGHMRRAGLPPGTLEPVPPVMQRPRRLHLDPQEMHVLLSLRAPLCTSEIHAPYPWAARAAALNMPAEDYYRTAHHLVEVGALGRFATILNHTAPAAQTTAATGSASLIMWALTQGEEEAAGCLCAQHVCMTHCYWRNGTTVFGNPQIMGMIHAPSQVSVLSYKNAIDAALSSRGLHLLHTQMFWTERACVRSSEINPAIYCRWKKIWAQH